MTVHCIFEKEPKSGKNCKILHMFYQTLFSQFVQEASEISWMWFLHVPIKYCWVHVQHG